jgi:TonB family protein
METWKQWEGQVVNGEFPLRRYLGGSDHSAVFLTERGEPESQKAAIKLIAATPEDPEIQLSWWELGAKLSHPNLLHLGQRGHCQVDDKELLYAVSEYADENLAQILPQRALTPAEMSDVLQAVLNVLAYVHSKGFVHGHLKPSNIMAVGDQVKISSDGLCGVGESCKVAGQPGIYMAPEIVSGGGMSPASDVWALGMTLVEALTQRPPRWDGTQQNGPIIPETLPTPFLEIARRCLRREPQQRGTIAEIAARLQAVSPALQGVHEVRTDQPKQATKKSRYMLASAAVGLLLLVILAPRFLNRHSGPEPVASTAVDSSKAQPDAKPEGDNSAAIIHDQNKEQAPSVPVASPGRTNSRSARTSAGASNQSAVVQQVVPEVSRSARNTIQGRIKVSVKVAVDESGNVTSAKFVSRGPSKYFAKLALGAAQRWTFKPPQAGGQGVTSEWIIKFEFSRAATNVHPTQTLP